MNIDLGKVLEWFKTLASPSPTRDWRLIVSVAGVLVLLGFGLAAYLFWGVQSGSIIAAGAEAPRPPTQVSRALIKRVQDSYRARLANYTAKNFPAYNVIDPRAKTKK